jgi:hypothetical protein
LKSFVLALVLLGTLSGCADFPRTADQKAGWVNDQLYFGLSSPDGEITDAQWQAFLSDVVTPRFPDGLTAWDAKGQWKNQKGEITREPSRVLQLVHPASAKADAAIAEIIAAYKNKFRQESVMKLRNNVEAGF